MTSFFPALAIAGFATLFANGAFAAQISDCDSCNTPIAGSFAVSIWSANTYGANINSASQSALPTNPIVTAANLVSTGVYNGGINFNYDPARGTPTIAGFLATGGGTYTGSGNTNVLLSGSGFSHATVIEFSFTIAQALTNIAISHDDGVSLFAAGNPNVDLLPSSAASPTNTADTTLASLAAGTYNLWYAEVNGVPAVLCFDPTNNVPATKPTPTATPEPASLGLLGAGLAAIGFVRRRRTAA